MKTPPEYTKNLKKKLITEQMLSDCLFSVNKRAKNYRDQAQKHKFDITEAQAKGLKWKDITAIRNNSYRFLNQSAFINNI